MFLFAEAVAFCKWKAARPKKGCPAGYVLHHMVPFACVIGRPGPVDHDRTALAFTYRRAGETRACTVTCRNREVRERWLRIFPEHMDAWRARQPQPRLEAGQGKGKGQAGQVVVAVVTRDYVAEASDHVSVAAGDMVHVREQHGNMYDAV
jgi:hypothetical protein